jgi:HEAT repeat protein
LIRYLKSQEELVQRAALAEFAGMGATAKKAVPAIVEALHDPKSSIRMQAAVTLIHMDVQAKLAAGALAKELQSDDPAARARAAGAIDQLVTPPPEVLGSSCWGPDPPPRIARPWVRKAVALALK